jgi:toxin ParE1/3/4
MKELEITPHAQEDIQGIWDYFALINPAIGDGIIQEFDKVFTTLQYNPELGKKYHKPMEHIRSLSVEGHVIFYTTTNPDKIKIYRVIHQARDIEAVLTAEPSR